MTEKRSSRLLEQESQTGILFIPGIRHYLSKIISQLDPASFVKLSRTCKDMYNFCFNTKDTCVRFPLYTSFSLGFRVPVVRRRSNIGFPSKRIRLLTRYPMLTDEQMAILQKPPFVVTIEEVFHGRNFGHKVTSNDFWRMSNLFRSFRCIRLGNIHTNAIEDWNDFAYFVKKFGAEQVKIGSSTAPKILSRDLLPLSMNTVEKFNYYGPVPDEFVLSATSKRLYLPNARISMETFRKLVQLFRDGSFSNWAIGLDVDDRLNVFENVIHPSLDACSEEMKVVTVTKIIQSKMKPFTIYTTNRTPKKFFLRKADGSIGKFAFLWPTVNFGVT